LAHSDSMPPHPVLQPYARSMTLEGRRLFYYEAGASDAPPLVLLHGLGDEADTWWRMLPALARNRRVIAPDLPGFGRSAGPSAGYTGAFFAHAVAGLLRALGIIRATLAGHSLGAAVAQRLALAQPGLVDRLVLISGGLPIEIRRPASQMWLFLTPGLGEALYTSLRRSQDEAYATLQPYYLNLDALPDSDRAFLRQRVWARVWSASQRRAFLSALRWLAADHAMRVPAFRLSIARTPLPTRIIWGDQDLIAPPGAGVALAQIAPAAELHLIADGGHNVHQERPDQVVRLLRD
jgi:pimeloyl-ACP methyl ester carboxylesterase